MECLKSARMARVPLCCLGCAGCFHHMSVTVLAVYIRGRGPGTWYLVTAVAAVAVCCCSCCCCYCRCAMCDVDANPPHCNWPMGIMFLFFFQQHWYLLNTLTNSLLNITNSTPISISFRRVYAKKGDRKNWNTKEYNSRPQIL